jgi:homoserine O-acetyltransferase
MLRLFHHSHEKEINMESALLDDSRRTILSKNRRPALVAIAVIVVCGIAQQAIGQNGQVPIRGTGQASVDGQRQSDVIFSNYKFRDGETLPQLRIHYATLGNPHRNAEGTVDNAILLLHWTNASSQASLVPEYQEAVFSPGAPLDTARFFVIIPDDVGHGRSSKPSDGLRAAFPHYGYQDMVDLQHKLVTESLGIHIFTPSSACRWVA